MSPAKKALRPALEKNRINRIASCLTVFLAVLAMTAASAAFADEDAKTPEDLKREAAIAQFTQKMKDANYPALFAQAAAEYRVPQEILEGVSFAETRWEHLQWPEGQTVSPENGMPRPYGIMSLWDNDYFGHTLQQAANLIGKSPEALKNNPLDNMRGAAALLRQIYDKNPKPDFANKGDLESWFTAISKYCSIPQPELNSQHALEVYRHLDQGYDQYGIQIDKVPGLKLEAMTAAVTRIKELANRQKMVTMTPEDLAGMGPPPEPASAPKIPRTHHAVDLPSPAPAAAIILPATNYALLAIFLAGGVMIYFLTRTKTRSTR